MPILPVYLSLLSNSTNENETKTSFFYSALSFRLSCFRTLSLT
ncbi:MAG: hypothetical protein J6D33_00055 [Turicibacter sp.]|nr:hypothetical protein [Turicibacter sp.]